MTVSPRPGRPAGVYVHIPFCDRLCPYCDFAVAVRRPSAHQPYLDALYNELASRRAVLDGAQVGSVYLGGGTPSAIGPSALAKLLGVLLRDWAPQEVTVEVNPNHVTDDLVQALADAGATRLSLGVQSFQPAYLAALGRTHTGPSARAAVERAQKAFENVTVDLIVAGPGHTPPMLDEDLRILAEHGVPHVSVYELTVEPQTVFGRLARKGQLHVCDDDTTADMLEVVETRLASQGLHKYEVSNYGRPGFESRHNLNYWSGGEYLGLGLGAHGLQIDGQVIRTANTRGLRAYVAGETVLEREVLTSEQHLVERLFVGLRATTGIDLDELEGQGLLRHRDRVETMLGTLRERGLVEFSGRFRPTPKGLMLSNVIADEVATLT